MFIRLIITSNVMSLALTWMPKFMTWGKQLTQAVLDTENAVVRLLEYCLKMGAVASIFRQCDAESI